MKYLLLFSAFAVLTTGCRKNLDDVDDVHFDVSLEAETFKVGEPVRFHFSGNPDFIIFYSGEKGNDYAYKDTDRIMDSEMTFSFSTTTTAGTAGNPNPSHVPVCYSTDFSGEYTEEAVRAATWIDITDRFKMPTDTGITALLSGDVNVTEYFSDPESPLYFSFHWVVEPYDAAIKNGRTQWNIQATKFNGIAGESVSTLYDFADIHWQPRSKEPLRCPTSTPRASFSAASSSPRSPANAGPSADPSTGWTRSTTVPTSASASRRWPRLR